MAQVIAVASAKGGVGKTTTAANLAAVLAALDVRVVAVDADLGMPNLAAAFGVDDDGRGGGTESGSEPGAETGARTLHDVLAGRGSATDAVRPGAAGVDVLAGATALDAYRDADPTGLEGVIDDLEGEYDAVVVDTGAGLSHDTVVPLGLANEVLLVTTPDRDAVGDTVRTHEVADRVGGTVAGVALTRVREGEGLDADAVADRLDLSVVGSIPEDDAVRAAADAGVPVVEHAPRSPAAGGYRALTGTLAEVDVPEPDPEPKADAEVESESATAVTATAEAAEDDADEAEPGPEAAEDRAVDPETGDEPEAAPTPGGDAGFDDVTGVGGLDAEGSDDNHEPESEPGDTVTETVLADKSPTDDPLGGTDTSDDAPLGGDPDGGGLDADGLPPAGGAGHGDGNADTSTDAEPSGGLLDEGATTGTDGSDDALGITTAQTADPGEGTDFGDLGRVGADDADGTDGGGDPDPDSVGDALGDSDGSTPTSDGPGPGDGDAGEADDETDADGDGGRDRDRDGDEDGDKGGFLSRLFG
jgi:septum site-determining protein MinD